MNQLPQRKHPRLKEYDYGEHGAYFVTICTENRAPILSTITVGRGLAPAETRLTIFGKIAEEQLTALPQRYPHVTVDQYVIMPNHVHMLLTFHETAGVNPRPTEDVAAGASPRPTLPDVVCAYKSLTTRGCKAAGFSGQKLFQTSFYDHVVRGRKDYEEIWQYIENNPARWAEDKLYCDP